MFSRPGNNMDIFTDILIGSIVRAEIRHDSVILSTKDNLVGGFSKTYHWLVVYCFDING